jgi:hypothetical protein
MHKSSQSSFSCSCVNRSFLTRQSGTSSPASMRAFTRMIMAPYTSTIPSCTRRPRDRVVVGIHWSGSIKSTMFDSGPAINCYQRGLNYPSGEGRSPPVRSINSVAKDSALSVRGSAVESVRVPNDTVNILLQATHHVCQTLTSTQRQKRYCAYFNA